MTMHPAFVAKVKSKFGQWAVVRNKKVVAVAVLRDKAMAQCNGLNGYPCADCDHPKQCAAYLDMTRQAPTPIN